MPEACVGANAEAELTLYTEYMAIQRVRKLMKCVSLPNLLFFLLGQSFRKVGLLLQDCKVFELAKPYLLLVGSDIQEDRIIITRLQGL
jgi:hypothetical protein